MRDVIANRLSASWWLKQEPALWGCLAVMAVQAHELHAAETAFAALDEVWLDRDCLSVS